MKKFKTPLGVLVVTVLVVWLLNTLQPTAKKAPPIKASAIPVEALLIQRQDYQVNIASQGIIAASTEALLSAQVRGNIVSVHPQFQRGGRFEQGDVLLTVDDGDYIAALKLAEANVSKAEVALAQEQARSVSAIEDWRRLGFEDEPNDLTARRSQVAAATAEKESAVAALIKAQLDVSRTRIVAPFDGRVVGETITLGSFVSPGITLAKIIEADALKVALPISAQWRAMLLPATGSRQSVRGNIVLTLPAGKEEQWQASVSKTGAVISTDSRQFFVIAEVDTSRASTNGLELLVGDYVEAIIEGRMLRDVIVIPREALYQGQFVWLIENNKIYKTAVHVMWSDGNIAVIDRGLEQHTHIAASPVGVLISGTPVVITAQKQQASEPTKPVLPHSDKANTSQVSNTIQTRSVSQ